MTSVKTHALAAAMAAAALCAAAAHAEISGESSDTSKLRVGTSNFISISFTPGRPGVAAIGTGLQTLFDFQTLQGFSPPDANGVSSFRFGPSLPNSFSAIGVFRFSQVSSADVYFGEWSQTGDMTAGDHTVYYVGDDGGSTTVPTSGIATYSINGVSDYDNNGLLSGTFLASFQGAGGVLAGSISNSASGYGVNIGTAVISGVNFSGNSATATQSGVTVASGGDVSGRFFGADAAALAGIATFADRQYDTAFGGAKN